MTRRAALARLAAAAALAVVGLLPAPAPALAADPVLPRPTAAVTFLDRIEFSGQARLSGGIARLEIVVDIEGSGRSLVADVAVPDETGLVEIGYVLDTSGGSLFPNTDVVARFRATLDDGTTVTGPSVSVRYDDTRFSWNDRTGASVTVRWTEGGAAFGRRAVQIADDAVREVSDLLGVAESGPIDFYVYADRDAFYDVLGAASRENVGGEAHPDIRTLFANISPTDIDDPWVGVVIPHELTHLVFDTAVANPYHYPPRWLNEGVAVYLSEGYGAADRAAVEDAARGATLMPLGALTGQFPTTADQFRLAYSESVSAVDFLVREYGQPAMVALVRGYADGVTDDEAFLDALGVDVAGFEGAWLEALGAEAPVPYGPAEAPAGPVPPDWRGEGEAPGPITTRAPGATAAPAGPTPAPGGEAIGVLAGLVVAGAAFAGVGVWLVRRQRNASRSIPVAASAGVPAVPPAAAPDAGPAALTPSLWVTRGVEPSPAPSPPLPAVPLEEPGAAPPFPAGDAGEDRGP